MPKFVVQQSYSAVVTYTHIIEAPTESIAKIALELDGDDITSDYWSAERQDVLEHMTLDEFNKIPNTFLGGDLGDHDNSSVEVYPFYERIEMNPMKYQIPPQRGDQTRIAVPNDAVGEVIAAFQACANDELRALATEMARDLVRESAGIKTNVL